METIVTEKPVGNNAVTPQQRMNDLRSEDNAKEEIERQARKSPYRAFYQINNNNSCYLRELCKENPKALELLFFIFEHMDKFNALVCSYAVFQEALGVSKATIQRSVKYLKDHGYLYVYRSGTSNVYVANDDLVWKSWGTNHEYCEFPANVVLSSSEQMKREENIVKSHNKVLKLKEDEKKNA